MKALLAYGRMVKFSHSIFAMPFALASALIASREASLRPVQWALIVVCMMAARSAAMGFNRLVDRDFDAQNPRTATREIPSGQVSVGAARAFVGLSSGTFVLASFALQPLCGYLSPVALLIVGGYSYAKRFTVFVHIWLGVALGLAPIAAWIAVTGGVSPVALVLALAVATWVAGFDILYSLQDEDFDRGAGLHSIPARLGRVGALWVSGGLHVVTILALAFVPSLTTLAWPYWVGLLVIAGVLAYEHFLIRPNDISKIDKAFFDLNGYVGLLFLAAVFWSV